MKFTEQEIDINKKAFEELYMQAIIQAPKVKSNFLNATPFSLKDPPALGLENGRNIISDFLSEYNTLCFMMDDEIQNQCRKYGLPDSFPKRYVSFTSVYAELKKLESIPGLLVMPENIFDSLYHYQKMKHIYDFGKFIGGTMKYGKRRNAIFLNIFFRNFFRKLKYGNGKLIKQNDKAELEFVEKINFLINEGCGLEEMIRMFSNLTKGVVEKELLFLSIQNDFYFDPTVFKKGIDYAVLFDLYYPFLKHDFTIYESEESPGYRSQNGNYQNFSDYKRRILKKIIQKR